jgi:hypothetical protein
MNGSKNISLNFSDKNLAELIELLKTVDALKKCEPKNQYEVARFKG